MKKKLPFVLSFALAALIVIGQASFAKGGSDDSNMGNMMNMMNGNGMAQMMENGTMTKMMNAMNSPEGKKMISDCQNFMNKYSGGK